MLTAMSISNIKLGIAEDHKLLRQDLVSLLDKKKEFSVIFDAANGRELLSFLEQECPDILLLDLVMPEMDGFEALKYIKIKYPLVKVIVLSSYYEDEFILETVRNGARGFLAKNTDLGSLLKAIYKVDTRGYYFDDKVTPLMIHKIQQDNINRLL